MQSSASHEHKFIFNMRYAFIEKFSTETFN